MDFKNVQRRVYDALNVLSALNIIDKDRNRIKYRGSPYINGGGVDQLIKAANLQKEVENNNISRLNDEKKEREQQMREKRNKLKQMEAKIQEKRELIEKQRQLIKEKSL